MARIRCFLYHSMRLGRDARWADAYRAGRPGDAEREALHGREGTRTPREAQIIRLAERRAAAS